MEMNVEKRLQQRVERITKAFAHEIPDRVPITMMLETWAGHYAGTDLIGVAYDFEKLKTSFCKVAEDFPQLDALPPAFGVRPANVYTALASREFKYYDEEGTPYVSLQHTDAPGGVMFDDEFDELIADPFKFIMEKQLPRRYAALDQPADQKAMALSLGALAFRDFVDKGIVDILVEMEKTHGMPPLLKGSTEMPLDALMDYFRGFNDIMIDIRRRKDKVIDAAEALYPLMLRRAANGLERGPFPGIFIPLHIPTYLKPRDFEKFYFPTFKRMIEDLVDYDLTPILFMEGNWEPYFDFINELPKKKVAGLIETADFKKLKEGIGDTICIIGGMSQEFLNHASHQELEKRTAELIDILAPGGGYIFSLDKSMLAPGDADPAKLKTAFDAVIKYGKYE